MSEKMRRSNGEGHYYKKKVNGTEYFCWKIDTGRVNKSGNRHFKVITGKTPKELKNKVKEYLKDLKEKTEELDIPKIQTLNQYIELYLTTIKPAVKRKTYESYSAMAKRYFINSEISKLSMKKITSRQIQDFLNSYTEKLSPVSIGDIRRCLHTIFQRAVDEKIILSNPVTTTKAPRVLHKEIKILTEEEVKKILQTANDGEYIHSGSESNYNFGEDDSMIYNRHAFYVALCVLWYAGLRRGECWGLSWDNIDFKRNTVRICQNYQPSENGKGYIDDPKTRNSIRTISLPVKMMKILSEWKKGTRRFRPKI